MTFESSAQAGDRQAGPRVTVVTVTYGKRLSFIEQVVRAIDDKCPQVSDVVIVDNASSDDVHVLLDAKHRVRFHLLRFEKNRGSSGGFAAGIRLACERTGAEFLWLLDDDNRPEEGALAHLLAAIADNGGSDVAAALAFRPDEGGQAEAMRRGYHNRSLKNSFCNFHVRELLRKLAMRKFPRYFHSHPNSDSVFPAYEAPFGGLLFSRSWVNRIGIPKEAFYLYYDDVEYSWRFVEAGAKILHCRDAIVTDLESGWYRGIRGNPLFSCKAKEYRVWFAIRNRVFLERQKLVSSIPMYLFNTLACCVVNTILFSIREGHPLVALARFRLIVRAALEGWNGRLGSSVPAGITLNGQ